MLTDETLKERPREFLAATGLTHAEFACLVPAVAAAYAALYPPDKPVAGKGRHRQGSGGATGVWPQLADKRFLILVDQKTHPLSGQRHPRPGPRLSRL